MARASLSSGSRSVPLCQPAKILVEMAEVDRLVALVVPDPGIDVRQVGGEPLAVLDRDRPIRSAVAEPDRREHVRDLEAPVAAERSIVLDPALR